MILFADINGDGVVGVPDLLLVIGAWGPCVPATMCVADIAPPGGDGSVGTADLLAVIGAWGPCGSSLLGSEAPPSWLENVTAVLENNSLSEAEKLELIQAIVNENQ